MRVADGALRRTSNDGFLHRLTGSRPTERRLPTRVVASTSPTREGIHLLHREFMLSLNPRRLDRLADTLGLSRTSLTRLSVGWSYGYTAFTFPMYEAGGHVVGFRLRLNNGRKLSVAGGREGLFIPKDLPTRPARLFITEGPSDCAALVDLGLDAVGRPSCTGGVRLVADLVTMRQPSAVVVVADADEPGQRGAEALACILALSCPDVRVVTPPAGVKDARAWKLAGATADAVRAAAEAAPVIRLTIFQKDVCRGN
jgi:hypothetical protein